MNSYKTQWNYINKIYHEVVEVCKLQQLHASIFDKEDS